MVLLCVGCHRHKVPADGLRRADVCLMHKGRTPCSTTTRRRPRRKCALTPPPLAAGKRRWSSGSGCAAVGVVDGELVRDRTQASAPAPRDGVLLKLPRPGTCFRAILAAAVLAAAADGALRALCLSMPLPLHRVPRLRADHGAADAVIGRPPVADEER